MNLAPLLNASVVVQIHVAAAIAAFVVGMVQLTLPKGTGFHRVLGWTWVALVAFVCLSSFWIHELRQIGSFSWEHILAIWTLCILPFGIYAARRHDRLGHGRIMIALFFWSLTLAGLLAFIPGRIMHASVAL